MYTVIYRVGGPARFEWRRIYTQFNTMQKAIDMKNELIKMGYRALIFKSKELDLHGMPTTWD